ncbi:hypothetical protein BPIT_04840 [Candidatus Brocadia pituitae]|nr:hypothetical protein BPIT_04840 [Candidatus Brocadia pituitae]
MAEKLSLSGNEFEYLNATGLTDAVNAVGGMVFHMVLENVNTFCGMRYYNIF